MVARMLQAFHNGEGSICDAAVVLRVLGFVSASKLAC